LEDQEGDGRMPSSWTLWKYVVKNTGGWKDSGSCPVVGFIFGIEKYLYMANIQFAEQVTVTVLFKLII
jgi:hypothetical protein